MRKYLILYNPLANQGKGREKAEILEKFFPDSEIEYADLTAVKDLKELFVTTPEEVEIVFTGGDGTLSKMLNFMSEEDIQRKILYFPAGTGNDFINDTHRTANSGPFPINEYLEGLPSVTVNGITCKFMNGIGFGLDGYCCEESDRLKDKGKHKSYTAIAAEGVLFKFHPTNATVTVDGETRTYRRVFMAPSMFGQYFGGGVRIAPHQDRKNPEHTVTNVVIHNISRVHGLLIFLKVVGGKGDRYPKHIDYRVGHHIVVEFDRPTALQIDGETVRNVLRYEVQTAEPKKC